MVLPLQPLQNPYVKTMGELAGIYPPETTYPGVSGTKTPPAMGVGATQTAVKGVSSEATGTPEAGGAIETRTTPQTSIEAIQGIPEPTIQGGEAYKIPVREYGGNPAYQGVYQSLFAPISEPLKKTSKQLGSTVTGFLGEAGPRRTYESIGGAQTMGQILSGERPEREGTSYVQAAYGGPTELSPGELDKMVGGFQSLRQWQQALHQPGGLEELLSQRNPGLTPGELSFEAKRLRAEPGYKAAQMGAEQDIWGLSADYLRAQQQAEAIAKQRAADEAAISKSATEYFNTQQDALEKAWDDIIKQRESENIAAEEAYNRFQQTGTVEDLNKLGQMVGQDLSGFNTEARKTTAEAEKAFNDVMNKYSEISSIPLMSLQTTTKGRETLGFDQEWWDKNKDLYSKSDWAAIKEKARQRQKDLEAAGFANQYSRGRYTAVTAEIGGPDEAAQTTKYGLYRPIYYTGALEKAGMKPVWESPEFKTYISDFNMVSPTRANVSTQQQRGIYNKINRILGDAETFDPNNLYEAWRGASVIADLGRYLEDEKIALDERRGVLTDAQKEWMGQVQKARKKYEKIRSRNRWAAALITHGTTKLMQWAGAPGADKAVERLSLSEPMQKAIWTFDVKKQHELTKEAFK